MSGACEMIARLDDRARGADVSDCGLGLYSDESNSKSLKYN